ncbi:hypothetical protein ACA910_010654 [Epithemia clementina (nom. ined.)]
MRSQSFMDKVRLFDQERQLPQEAQTSNNFNEESRVDADTARGGDVSMERQTIDPIQIRQKRVPTKATPPSKYISAIGKKANDDSFNLGGPNTERARVLASMQSSRGHGSTARDQPPTQASSMKPTSDNKEERDQPIGNDSEAQSALGHSGKPLKVVRSLAIKTPEHDVEGGNKNSPGSAMLPRQKSPISRYSEAYERSIRKTKGFSALGQKNSDPLRYSKDHPEPEETQENKPTVGFSVKDVSKRGSSHQTLRTLQVPETHRQVSFAISSSKKGKVVDGQKAQSDTLPQSMYEKLLARHKRSANAKTSSENTKNVTLRSPNEEPYKAINRTRKLNSSIYSMRHPPAFHLPKENETTNSPKHSPGGFEVELLSAAKALARKPSAPTKQETSDRKPNKSEKNASLTASAFGSSDSRDSPLTIFKQFRNELKTNLNAATVILAEEKSGASGSSASLRSSLSNQELVNIARVAASLSKPLNEKSRQTESSSQSSLTKMQQFHQQRRNIGSRDQFPGRIVAGERLPPRNEQSATDLNEPKVSYEVLGPSLSNSSTGNIAPSYSNGTSHSEATARASNTEKSRAAPSVPPPLRRINAKNKAPIPVKGRSLKTVDTASNTEERSVAALAEKTMPTSEELTFPLKRESIENRQSRSRIVLAGSGSKQKQEEIQSKGRSVESSGLQKPDRSTNQTSRARPVIRVPVRKVNSAHAADRPASVGEKNEKSMQSNNVTSLENPKTEVVEAIHTTSLVGGRNNFGILSNSNLSRPTETNQNTDGLTRHSEHPNPLSNSFSSKNDLPKPSAVSPIAGGSSRQSDHPTPPLKQTSAMYEVSHTTDIKKNVSSTWKATIEPKQEVPEEPSGRSSEDPTMQSSCSSFQDVFTDNFFSASSSLHPQETFGSSSKNVKSDQRSFESFSTATRQSQSSFYLVKPSTPEWTSSPPRDISRFDGGFPDSPDFHRRKTQYHDSPPESFISSPKSTEATPQQLDVSSDWFSPKTGTRNPFDDVQYPDASSPHATAFQALDSITPFVSFKGAEAASTNSQIQRDIESQKRSKAKLEVNTEEPTTRLVELSVETSKQQALLGPGEQHKLLNGTQISSMKHSGAVSDLPTPSTKRKNDDSVENADSTIAGRQKSSFSSALPEADAAAKVTTSTAVVSQRPNRQFPADSIQFQSQPSTPISSQPDITSQGSPDSTSSLSDNDEVAPKTIPRMGYPGMTAVSHGRKTDVGDLKLTSPRQNWSQLSQGFDDTPNLKHRASPQNTTNEDIVDIQEGTKPIQMSASESMFSDNEEYAEGMFPGVKSRMASFERRKSNESLQSPTDSLSWKKDPFLSSPKDKTMSKVTAIRESFERYSPQSPPKQVSVPRISPQPSPAPQREADTNTGSELPTQTGHELPTRKKSNDILDKAVVQCPPSPTLDDTTTSFRGRTADVFYGSQNLSGKAFITIPSVSVPAGVAISTKNVSQPQVDDAKPSKNESKNLNPALDGRRVINKTSENVDSDLTINDGKMNRNSSVNLVVQDHSSCKTRQRKDEEKHSPTTFAFAEAFVDEIVDTNNDAVVESSKSGMIRTSFEAKGETPSIATMELSSTPLGDISNAGSPSVVHGHPNKKPTFDANTEETSVPSRLEVGQIRSQSSSYKRRSSTMSTPTGSSENPRRRITMEGFPSDRNPAASEGVRRMADALQWWQERYSATARYVENSAIKKVLSPSSIGSSEAANYQRSPELSPISRGSDKHAESQVKEEDDVFSGLEEETRSQKENGSLKEKPPMTNEVNPDVQSSIMSEIKTSANTLNERTESTNEHLKTKHEQKEGYSHTIPRRRRKGSLTPDMTTTLLNESAALSPKQRTQSGNCKFRDFQMDNHSRDNRLPKFFWESKGAFTPDMTPPPPPPPSLSSPKRSSQSSRRRLKPDAFYPDPLSLTANRTADLKKRHRTPGIESISLSDSSVSMLKPTPREVTGDNIVKTITSDITESQVSAPITRRSQSSAYQDFDKAAAEDSGIEIDIDEDVHNSKNLLRDQTSNNAGNRISSHKDGTRIEMRELQSSASGSAEIEYDGYESVNTNTISGSHEQTIPPEETSGAFFLYAILDTFTDACKMTAARTGDGASAVDDSTWTSRPAAFYGHVRRKFTECCFDEDDDISLVINESASKGNPFADSRSKLSVNTFAESRSKQSEHNESRSRLSERDTDDRKSNPIVDNQPSIVESTVDMGEEEKTTERWEQQEETREEEANTKPKEETEPSPKNSGTGIDERDRHSTEEQSSDGELKQLSILERRLQAQQRLLDHAKQAKEWETCSRTLVSVQSENSEKDGGGSAFELSMLDAMSPRTVHTVDTPLTNHQKNVLERFSSMLRNERVEVLKLNRHDKWQVRFLTVSKEYAWLRGNEAEGDAGQCPQALLWLKTANGKNTGVAGINDEGRGGFLFTQLEKIERDVNKLPPVEIPKKLTQKFPNYVGVNITYRTDDGSHRSLVFCLKTRADARAFITSMEIIRAVIQREEATISPA